MKKHYLPNYPAQKPFPISKSGYPFIFALGFTTLISSLLNLPLMSFVFLFLTFFTCFFFRDPDRLVPVGEKTIVSPADGKIIGISKMDNAPYIKGESYKISIFMSIFNVHINRISLGGIIKKIEYIPGKYFSANLNKASEKNERNIVIIETNSGLKMCLVQIAGLIARRIVCSIQPGDLVKKGQRYGLICFGSRLELYLPSRVSISVKEGDKVLAGSSILGELLDVT